MFGEKRVWPIVIASALKRRRTWKYPGFKQGSTDPVVGVSWNDAKAFCEWLTKLERDSGTLPENIHFRLPSDEEWSVAVGLNSEPGNTPEEKNSQIRVLPWGTKWAPPTRAGNYAGEESRIGKEPEDWAVIKGYHDGYPRTSPVESFAANKNGLHDMAGNVLHWCGDWYNSDNKYRVLRGASWFTSCHGDLLASYRANSVPDYSTNYIGFRCVMAQESSR